MSLTSLFRVGKPKVTETTSNFTCGRSTGGLGTGVYAYKDLDAALNDYSYKHNEQPIFELKSICKNPLEPIFEDDTYGLNDAGTAMICGEVDKAVSKLSFVNGINLALSKKYGCKPMFDKECKDILKDKIIASIQKTNDCIKKHEKDEPYRSSKHCSQPINHLLNDLGFDCVLPTDKAKGNSNTFGSVILKETVDKELGKKTVGYENIDNFGTKLDR